jgi:hypothetical protein
MNNAQKLLASIGGLASLVAGEGEHFYADSQTPKSVPQRPRKGRGNYGEGIKAAFDKKKATAARLQAHQAYLAHQEERKRQRAAAKGNIESSAELLAA